MNRKRVSSALRIPLYHHDHCGPWCSLCSPGETCPEKPVISTSHKKYFMKIKSYFFLLFLFMSAFLISCRSHKQTNSSTSSPSNPSDWKFGVALWTFHTVNFPESLKMVDSTGVRYIEPNTFHKSG